MMTATAVPPREAIWFRSRSWDLTWLTASGLFIALPIVSYAFFKTDQARVIINLIVTLLIGGPHMYATATLTAFEPRFRRRYKWLMLAAGVIIPATVVTLTLTNYVALLTLFFGWASVHILHQASYITARYTDRAPWQSSWTSRAIDYAVIFTALYPFGVYKMVHGTFKVGPTKLWFPDFLRHDWVWQLAFLAFFASLAAFVARTMREHRAGVLNVPKTLFVSATALGAFVVPMFHNMDTSFQGFNTWHSFQYMGLVWHLNRLRRERGAMSGALQRRMFDGGAAALRKFYGFTIGLTLVAGAMIWGVYRFSGWRIDQSYYTVTLSFLLVHYAMDHVIFFQREDELAALAERRAA